MISIYKYPLEITDSQKVLMPVDAVILDIQHQGNQLVLWAIVPLSAIHATRHFLIFGTGQPLDFDSPEDLLVHFKFIKTVQVGPLVWHVFEQRVAKKLLDRKPSTISRP